jgi:hypothetical protein
VFPSVFIDALGYIMSSWKKLLLTLSGLPTNQFHVLLANTPDLKLTGEINWQKEKTTCNFLNLIIFFELLTISASDLLYINMIFAFRQQHIYEMKITNTGVAR